MKDKMEIVNMSILSFVIGGLLAYALVLFILLGALLMVVLCRIISIKGLGR